MGLLGDLWGRIGGMAHIEFLGDSYQYAHRVLLGKIAPRRKWTVHPMMFRSRCECKDAPNRCPNEPGGGLDLEDYASFLGLRREQVLPRDQQAEPLGWRTLVNDVQYCEYLFLDPDTGIDSEGGQGRQKHIRGTDLATIARQEGRPLVLVFEHSYRREILTLGAVSNNEVRFLCNVCQRGMNGKNQGRKLCSRCKTVVNLRHKLADLCQRFTDEGVALHCGAVLVRSGSLVSYVWVSTNQDTVKQVRRILLDELPGPDWRLLACPCGECPVP